MPPPVFTSAFLWSSVGILVGALSAGPLGDRVGRKPLLIVSLIVFGVASYRQRIRAIGAVSRCDAFFHRIRESAVRFPARRASLATTPRIAAARFIIMLSFTGAPLGGFVGGQIVALWLLPQFGWPSIFIAGGLFPLILVPALADMAAGIAALSRS